jgi:hypothetical protein
MTHTHTYVNQKQLTSKHAGTRRTAETSAHVLNPLIIVKCLDTENPQTTDLQEQNELWKSLHRLNHEPKEGQTIMSTDLFHLQSKTVQQWIYKKSRGLYSQKLKVCKNQTY